MAEFINHYTSNKITLRLQQLEAEKKFWRVRGKGVHVWSMPQEHFETEEKEMPLPKLNSPDNII